MVTGCNLLGPVAPVCGSFARRTGVWRDVSRRRGEVASFPQRDLGGVMQTAPTAMSGEQGTFRRFSAATHNCLRHGCAVYSGGRDVTLNA